MSLFRNGLRVTPLGLAIGGTIGPAFLFILSLVDLTPRLVDPCTMWGLRGTMRGFGGVTGAGPFDPTCRGRMRGTSQTKLGAVAGFLTVHGGMLLACSCALVGAYRYRRYLGLGACFFMLL